MLQHTVWKSNQFASKIDQTVVSYKYSFIYCVWSIDLIICTTNCYSYWSHKIFFQKFLTISYVMKDRPDPIGRRKNRLFWYINWPLGVRLHLKLCLVYFSNLRRAWPWKIHKISLVLGDCHLVSKFWSKFWTYCVYLFVWMDNSLKEGKWVSCH